MAEASHNPALNRLPIGPDARRPLRQGYAVLRILQLALRAEVAGGEWVDAAEAEEGVWAAVALLSKIAFPPALDHDMSPRWRMPPAVRTEIAGIVMTLRAIARDADTRTATELVAVLTLPTLSLERLVQEDVKSLASVGLKPHGRAA